MWSKTESRLHIRKQMRTKGMKGGKVLGKGMKGIKRRKGQKRMVIEDGQHLSDIALPEFSHLVFLPLDL